MKAAFLTKDGMAVRDVPEPSCGPGQILVRVVGCGVCTGDLEAYRRRVRMTGETLMGHEASGEVVEIGVGVEGLAVGDIVTVLGGAYAEVCLTDPVSVVKLPPTVDPAWALGESLACCVHACDRSGIRLGDRVAVVGCGYMGLTCMQIACVQGAAEVVAIDPVPWRRDKALALGAATAISPEQAVGQSEAFDVVIEAAGNNAALDLCGELVRKHGLINIVGYHQTDGGRRSINMQQWNYKAITVVNGHIRRIDEKLRAMAAGVRLLAAGRVVHEPLVAWYPLADAARAFADLDAMKEGLFKAVLVP